MNADFADFYESSRDRCVSAISLAVRDRGLGEELAAEAFARAFARWPKLSSHPNPQAWVLRTALNLNVSRWRRDRRLVQLPHAEEPIAVPADGPIDQQIIAAIANLPVRQREVVALRIVLDLDTAATAEILDIAPGTVTAHLHRATSTLRAALADADEMETQP